MDDPRPADDRDARRAGAPYRPEKLPVTSLLGDPTLLYDLWEHDRRGYGTWGAGMRYRVENALGMWSEGPARRVREGTQ